MLTISKPLSSGQAQTYHKQEFTAAGQNYYKQDGAVEGEWQGKLADGFGLAGQPVEARHFALLSEGKNPQTEEQLIRSRASFEYKNADGTVTKTAEHRAGWDATFSAPKSVSLAALVGGDERVREAHREAVTAALTELERYTQARIGGNHPGETTGRFIAAKFEHDTARPVDGYAAPQLHTHAVVFNMTQRDNGKMRSLQTQSLFETQSYATAVYQSELTIRLRGMGYELTEGKSGAPEIKGFTQEYLDASSLRSQQIQEQLAKTGFQGPAAAQIAAHATRDGKLLLSPEEVLTAHRQLAAEHGNQAQQIVADAREQARRIERVPRQAPDRETQARAAVAYAKEHVFEREAVADRRAILRDALRRGMGETTPAEVKAEFDKRRALGEFRQAGSRTYDTERRYTTPETLAAERAVLAAVWKGQQAVEPMMTLKAAQEQAAAKPFLNPKQQAVIEAVLTSPDRVLGLQGLAGTGKTTTLESIRQGAETAGYAVEGFAPTSKAAGQLRDAGISATTLQSFLARGAQEQASDPHLYMLDESSLASTRQMRDFLRKLGPNDRVLIIGDTGQHQGVDAGRPFEQMQQAGMRTAKLDTIMRQKDPGLRTAVEHLAKGETEKGVELLKEHGRVREIADGAARIAAIAKEYVGKQGSAIIVSPADPTHRGGYAAKQGSTIIISPDNASRRELNQAVRAALTQAGLLKGDGQEVKTLIARSDLTGADRAWAARYGQGDVVRYAKGSDKLGIARGSYATVTSVDAARNEVTVRRLDGVSVAYDPTRLRGVSVYRELGREFATGDRLQFTAPDQRLGVANRDLATITEIKDGRFTVKLDGKEGRSVNFDPKVMPHIDHGYAVTSHSSQGLTVDRVLVNIDTAAPGSLMNTRLAYVAVSRAAEDVQIYTNKAEGLGKRLAAEVSKTAALNYSQAIFDGPAVVVGPGRPAMTPKAANPTAEMRRAARMLGTEEARIGVNLLEQQGHVAVDPDRAARFTRMVEDYARKPEGTVAVVTTADERQELNRRIRAELLHSGAVSPDSWTMPVLAERSISPRTAEAYRVGDVVEYSAGSPARGIQPNSRATVRAVHAERNQITVERQDGELATYNPTRLKAAGKSKVYNAETREIAVGDRIRINAANKEKGFRAGEFATVEAIRNIRALPAATDEHAGAEVIRGVGVLQVRTDAGKVFELNPAQAQHIEYGYAAEAAKPIRAERLLVSLDSPAQVEAGSPLLKAINRAEDTTFYVRDRFAFYDAKTPEEIQQFLTRTPAIAPVAAVRETAQQLPEPTRQQQAEPRTEARTLFTEEEHARHYAPLDKALAPAQAEGFGWLAETGTIQTYRHEQTGRNLHIDGLSGQFYDQQRTPISREAALAHTLSGELRLPETRQIAPKAGVDQGFGLSF